jgi:hypothetical protein
VDILGKDTKPMPNNDEWLGELAFTHYYTTLARFVGIDFEVRWKDLNYCEQQAWIEASKTVVEVAAGVQSGAPAVVHLALDLHSPQ